LPENILHQPEQVSTSLYQVLRSLGRAPSRAIQRVTAVNLTTKEAQLLNMTPNAAALRIVRTGYLDSGRPIEFTRGLYRSETYDFVSELRVPT
jgi:GntR family transcriptional regulator